MVRHAVNAAVIWAALTAIAVYWAATTAFNPPGYGVEAHLIDDAFRQMAIMAAPVFTFVLTVLGYALFRFRAQGDPPQDGPPIHGHGTITGIWLTITSSLAVLVIINPGVLGMLELMHPQAPDLVVEAQGSRFFWRIRYPEQNITAAEVVLPVNKRVQFNITATDVLHSFWIPAFRIKIDAVPGITTTTHTTPTKIGSFAQDDQLRVQCAELCGAGHFIMKTPVRVVEQSEFDAWVAEKKAAQ